MEDYSRSYYEVVFERDFLKKTGTAFQDFFSEIMEKCYPGDFQRVRPWGKLGDRKNDGYLRSKRMLFQVYAPNEMKLKDTLDKINEDFNGALPYWEDHFDYWVFTHNSQRGLSGDVLKRLLGLEKEHPHLKFLNWGYEELRNELFGLAEIDIAAILGPAPTRRDLHNMGYAELKIVLDHISDKEPLINQDISPTPNKKISSNGLSPHVENLIRDSHIKAVLVEKFFNETFMAHRATHADENRNILILHESDTTSS